MTMRERELEQRVADLEGRFADLGLMLVGYLAFAYAALIWLFYAEYGLPAIIVGVVLAFMSYFPLRGVTQQR